MDTFPGKLLPVLLLSAVSASAQCYQFSGGGATLQVNITSITSQTGPVFLNGYQTSYVYSSTNTLTATGPTAMSQAAGNGGATLQYAPAPPGGLDLTTLQFVVPDAQAANAPGASVVHTWTAMLAGNGNLIPGGLLPQTLPPISQWVSAGASNVIGTTYDYIQVRDGNSVAMYPITAIAACAAATSAPLVGGIVSASQFGDYSAAAPGSWIEIYGFNLAPDTRPWAAADFHGNNAPTALDGVQVSIGGQSAFVDYISPTQVNAQLPSNLATGGALPLIVANGSAMSAPINLTINPAEPGLLAPQNFRVSGNQYVVAQHLDGTYVLPAGAVAGMASSPAAPGETIVIYGVGFGSVIPNTPAGVIAAGDTQISSTVNILFGRTNAQLIYFGLAPGYIGLYQFDVVVPTLPNSNLVPLTYNVAGAAGTQTLVTAIQQQ